MPRKAKNCHFYWVRKMILEDRRFKLAKRAQIARILKEQAGVLAMRKLCLRWVSRLLRTKAHQKNRISTIFNFVSKQSNRFRAPVYIGSWDMDAPLFVRNKTSIKTVDSQGWTVSKECKNSSYDRKGNGDSFLRCKNCSIGLLPW